MFTGWTALFGLLSGIVSGVMPKALDIWGKSQDFKQEMQVRKLELEFRREDHKMAMERAGKEAELRMNESYYDALTEESKANREQMVELIRQQFAPTGIWWVDVFNSLLRPVCAAIVMLLFFVAVASYIFGVGAVNASFALKMAELFGFMVEAMTSFIFGYRATIKAPSIMAPSR